MALLGAQQRAGYLLLAVVVGHVVLISAQVNTRRGVPLLEAMTFGAFAEVQRGASAAVRGIRTTWAGYLALRGVRAENDRLRQQLADARIQLQEQRALAARTLGLQRLLELRDFSTLQTVAAEIIGAGATPDFQTITIDKGVLDGLRLNMAVIAPDGIVGRVIAATPRASKVQLLIDRNAAAGVIVERTRAQGVVTGAGNTRLEMEYVPDTSEIEIGDRVVTSGIDGIFPKGFVVGRVERVERAGSSYRRITVSPAVDFSRLEAVLVVTTPMSSEAPPEQPSGESAR